MATPNVLVLSGYGINCEEETAYAFKKAGAKSEVVHVNDIVDGRTKLEGYQILAFPGGFSFGDDTGSGNAMANYIRNNLFDELLTFVHQDKLVIGICNGFQILVNLGLLPGIDRNYGERSVALTHNDPVGSQPSRYQDRWVDLDFYHDGPWTKDIASISLPIAHGEGKFYAEEKTLQELNASKMIAARYIHGGICESVGLPSNPNGSLESIAAITDPTGRVLGMMPHPERAIDATHHPLYTLSRENAKRRGRECPSEGQGLLLFKNARSYFK